MSKITLDQLTLIDLSDGKKQCFARKVVVVAYYMEKIKDNIETPQFIFTVITPKQPSKVTDSWDQAKSFKLPSGYSLIKGTREMFYDAVEQDIPPSFGGYFRQMVSGNLRKKAISSRVDGLVPAAITALKESKEEAGLKTSNIKLMFDLGIRQIKISGRSTRVNTFAIEVKKPTHGKAIDSLSIKRFSLRELRLASLQRAQYNIPLVRPSHVNFVSDIYCLLEKYYLFNGIQLSPKSRSKSNENRRIKKLKIHFQKLLIRASKGQFKSVKYSAKKTEFNIVTKSNKSRVKQKTSFS